MIIPLADRLLCVKREVVRNPYAILGPEREQISKTDTGVYLDVERVGKDVNDVVAGDVIIVADNKLIRIMRTRKHDGREYYMLHEKDVDGTVEDD